MDFNAYWLSPRGEIIGVPSIHISTVIKNPEFFGLTMDYINDMFAQFDEPVGFEGKARVEIMYGLIQKGWVRVRYTPRSDVWTLELKKLDSKAKDNVWTFFAKITGELNMNEAKNVSKFSDVRIVEIKDKESIFELPKTTINDVLAYTGLFEGAKQNHKMKLIEDVSTFGFRNIVKKLVG